MAKLDPLQVVRPWSELHSACPERWSESISKLENLSIANSIDFDGA
jgi:hypothetical protein